MSFLFHDQADSDPNLHGKKKVRKPTQAGGSGLDLAKIAAEQQIKLQKKKEEENFSKTSASISGSGIGSMSEGGSAFESTSGLGSGASSAIGGTGKDGQLLSIFSHRNKKLTEYGVTD